MTNLEIKIKLDTVKDISYFINIISIVPNIVYAKQDKYIVNAKSGMGLYSLDLNRPIIINVSGDLNSSFEFELRKFEV